MQRLWSLTVEAVPFAQPRQRHALVGGQVRNYTPSDSPVQTYKAHLRWAAKVALGARPSFDGPLILEARFYLPRPASLMRKKDPDGPVDHTARPDMDNLLKSTKDALSGLVWRDDCTVSRYKDCGKWYHEKNAKPRVELVLWRDM